MAFRENMNAIEKYRIETSCMNNFIFINTLYIYKHTYHDNDIIILCMMFLQVYDFTLWC